MGIVEVSLVLMAVVVMAVIAVAYWMYNFMTNSAKAMRMGLGPVIDRMVEENKKKIL